VVRVIRNALLQGRPPAPPQRAESTTSGTEPTTAPPASKESVSLRSFHDEVVIHRRGWTLVLNPDGITTAWNPGRTKVLHRHGTPAPAG
jgi:hypothetical protein